MRGYRPANVVQEIVPGERIRLRGENKSVIAVDTMSFYQVDGGTEVTHAADFMPSRRWP